MAAKAKNLGGHEVPQAERVYELSFDLETFIEVNEFEVNDPERARSLRGLICGWEHRGGGGAAPGWHVKRTK